MKYDYFFRQIRLPLSDLFLIFTFIISIVYIFLEHGVGMGGVFFHRETTYQHIYQQSQYISYPYKYPQFTSLNN